MSHDEIERREQPRSDRISGTAIVLGKRVTVSCSIGNLSASGVLLAADHVFAPGEHLRLLLHVEGAPSLGVAIEVLRVEPIADGRHRFAARFHDVEPETEKRIQAIVRSATAQPWNHARALLVVDDDPDVVAAVERDLEDAGYVVLHAATSHDVVRRLQDRSAIVEAALVDVRLRHINTTALLAQIADDYPRVLRVITTSRESVHECDALLASGRAQQLVHKPWERAALIEALGTLDNTEKLVIDPAR